MKKYTHDTAQLFGQDSAEVMAKLIKAGWKNLEYVSHDSWGDCRAPEIYGDRPLTEKEIKECDKAIIKENKREIRELKKLAKRHGFSIIPKNDLEYMCECPKCGTKINVENDFEPIACNYCNQEVVWRSVRMPFKTHEEI